MEGKSWLGGRPGRPAEVGNDGGLILPALAGGPDPGRLAELGAQVGQLPGSVGTVHVPVDLPLQLLRLEDAVDDVLLLLLEVAEGALGEELLEAAEADGLADGPNVRAGLVGFLGDALDDLEVGLGLHLDFGPLLLGEPGPGELLFVGTFNLLHSDVGVEADAFAFGGRGRQGSG